MFKTTIPQRPYAVEIHLYDPAIPISRFVKPERFWTAEEAFTAAGKWAGNGYKTQAVRLENGRWQPMEAK